MTITEADGPMAILGTLTRSQADSKALRVRLSLDKPGQARAPSEVIIPPNATQTTFYVSPIADGVADGNQVVTLTASAIIESCGCSAPSGSGGQVSRSFTVQDADQAILLVDFNRDLFAEGVQGAVILTITRSGTLDEALTVQLTADDGDELALPESVVIPIGESALSITLDTVADGRADGAQPVRVTASAPGYTSGYGSVVVSDIDLPDLVIECTTAPEDAATDSYAGVTYRMKNEGIWEAISSSADPARNFPGSWIQRVFLSDDPYIGNDVLVGDYTFTGTLPVSQWLEQTIPVRMPSQVGQYWVVLVTDVADQVSEGVETNNLSISQQPIQVYPAYSATVQASVDTAPAGSVVELSGRATDRAGNAAPFAMVDLHVSVRGITRVISALADEQGYYTTRFRPLSTEGGHYTVGASHPGVATAEVQDEFTLFGMRVEPAARFVSMIEEGSAGGSFTIRNMSEVPLTGLSYEVINPAANLDSQLIEPESTVLPSSGTQEAQVLGHGARCLDRRRYHRLAGLGQRGNADCLGGQLYGHAPGSGHRLRHGHYPFRDAAGRAARGRCDHPQCRRAGDGRDRGPLAGGSVAVAPG